jgi:hypothetical protein
VTYRRCLAPSKTLTTKQGGTSGRGKLRSSHTIELFKNMVLFYSTFLVALKTKSIGIAKY